MGANVLNRSTEILKGVVLTLVCALALYFLFQNAGVMRVCAGVCLFLFSMLLLEQCFKLLSGGILDHFLNRVADKNWRSFTFGFVLATLVQSSGLVTVIAVSFLSAGLITLASGVAMVYGVNLSAACTTWIVGYFGVQAEISLYSMPFIIVGVIFYLTKSPRTKGVGLFFLSLGLLFLGIAWMKSGFETFKDTLNLAAYAMPGLKGLLIYTVIGLLVTAITQSSHATITLAITALTVGQIDYMTAVGISIGAAVGSTIFTVIGSFNANIEGKKIAASHVIFKLICAFFAISLVNQYLWLTDWIAPRIGIADDDYVYKLAIFMSLFNLLGVLLLTPFIAQMCRFLNRLMPAKASANGVDGPRYLNDDALVYATSALKSLEMEMGHLLDNTLEIIARMIGFTPEEINSDEHAHIMVQNQGAPAPIDFQELYTTKFKLLYSEIIDYGVRAAQAQGMTDDRVVLLSDMRRACIIMAAAVKKSQQLQENMLRYGYSSNALIREEYSHIRRNLIRVIRLVKAIRDAKTPQDKEASIKRFSELKNKFDAIGSDSIDTLIRNRLVTDIVATSIMNDNANSRSIAKNLRHVTEIMTRTQESVDE